MWSQGSCRRWFNSSLVLFSQFCFYLPLDESGVFISCTQVFCASLIFRNQSFLSLSMQLLFERLTLHWINSNLPQIGLVPSLVEIEPVYYDMSTKYFMNYFVISSLWRTIVALFISLPKFKILCAKASDLGDKVKNIYRQTDRGRITGGRKKLTCDFSSGELKTIGGQGVIRKSSELQHRQ